VDTPLTLPYKEGWKWCKHELGHISDG
jgi:hypothetical protein